MSVYSSARAAPRTILVVDDSPDIRAALSEFLTEEGYPVVTARDGLEGLDLLMSIERPGLVLLDLRMPVLDGRQFVGLLRDRGALGAVAVVTISAALERPLPGTLGAMKKPIDLDELLGVVRTSCGDGVPAARA